MRAELSIIPGRCTCCTLHGESALVGRHHFRDERPHGREGQSHADTQRRGESKEVDRVPGKSEPRHGSYKPDQPEHDELGAVGDLVAQVAEGMREMALESPCTENMTPIRPRLRP